MDVALLHRRALQSFGAVVRAVPADGWHAPTPCADWNVHDLVNHLVNENCWTGPLFDGATVADVGERYDGDLLGSDPVTAWERSEHVAAAAVGRPGALAQTVHLSFGDTPGEEYARQLFADLLVHSWDLARAIGFDERLEPELVEACAAWFADREALYRGAGVIGPRVETDGDAQAHFLGAFGRDPSPDTTLAVIRRFNEAFGRHDVDAVMAAMTEDCVFEDTTPPHGNRHVGQADVRKAWEGLFGSSPTASFETEGASICGDRATYRWIYRFDGGSVRGVDVFRVRDGKVAEKLAYVKG